MFLSKLRMEHIERTKFFKVTDPLIYKNWKGEISETPVGFVFDGHSYPDCLDFILGNPVASETLESSVKHDYDCKAGIIPRRQADMEYSQAMSDQGWNFKDMGFSRAFRRKRNWVGVRIGAGWNIIKGWFRRKKDEDTEDIVH